MLAVGIVVSTGGGKVGRGPLPAETGSVAISPHAASESEARQAIKVIERDSRIFASPDHIPVTKAADPDSDGTDRVLEFTDCRFEDFAGNSCLLRC